MKKKRIYIILEVKERELLSKLLLAIQLSNSNYSVVFGKKNNLYNYSNLFQTGLFFFKGMGIKNIKPMKKLINLGHKVVGFDEEGLIANNERLIAGRVNETCLDLVEKFFTVGKKQLDNTLMVYNKYKNKIFEIGNVRFDLLKKEFSKFYHEEVEILQKKYGKFVLIADTFNRLHLGMPDLPPSYGKDYMQSNFDDQKSLEKKLKDFLSFFPQKYKDIKILVKPHPLGRAKYWEDIAEKINCANFEIADTKITTNAYLLASEFSIASNCTTAIESVFLDKPTVNFRAREKDGMATCELVRAVSSKEVLDAKELERVIVDWFYEDKKFFTKLTPDVKNILEHNIKNFENYSCKYYLEQINDLKINSNNKKDKFSNKFFVTFFRLIKKLKNFKYKILSKKKIDTISYEHLKFPSLPKKEIDELFLKLCNSSKIDPKSYSLNEIYPGCFCVEKN